MKIGIDCHNLETLRTGAARYLMNLLKHWVDKNHEFILYFKNKIPADIPNSDNFQKKILKTSSNALFVHYSLCWAATKDRVDILFCPAYVAPIFYKGKIALVLHDIIYEARPDLYNWPSIFDRILLKKVSKISAKKAKVIFTCSQFSKKEILKYYKVNSKKVFVIPLAADEGFKYYPFTFLASPSEARSGTPPSLPSPSATNHARSDCVTRKRITLKTFLNLKKKYGIKDKFIFYVGAVIKRRFISETIKAFAKVVEKLPGYQFLIGGPNYTNLKIDQKKVIHIDYIDEKDLPLLYNAADLFIWLSSYEGFGLPPLEAMACGTPVVTTKMGSLPEAMGDSALFVKNPEDIEEISQAIYKGLTDKNLQEELIKKGLEQAKKFSWQKTAEETLKILTYAK